MVGIRGDLSLHDSLELAQTFAPGVNTPNGTSDQSSCSCSREAYKHTYLCTYVHTYIFIYDPCLFRCADAYPYMHIYICVYIIYVHEGCSKGRLSCSFTWADHLFLHKLFQKKEHAEGTHLAVKVGDFLEKQFEEPPYMYIYMYIYTYSKPR